MRSDSPYSDIPKVFEKNWQPKPYKEVTSHRLRRNKIFLARFKNMSSQFTQGRFNNQWLTWEYVEINICSVQKFSPLLLT